MKMFEILFKMYMKILFICCVCVFVDSHEMKKGDRRKGRAFSFNPVNDDIAVSMDFSVPILKIPGKKSFYDALGHPSSGLPTINVNPASLALGGALIVGSLILMPLLLKNYASEYPQHRYAKLLNDFDFNADTMFNFVNNMFENRNLYGCSQRVACWTGQSTHNGEVFRTWTQIMNNQLLSHMVNTTAIAEAMELGRKGEDCLTFGPCPLQMNHLPMLIKNFHLLT